MINDKRKIFRPLSMENYFKANNRNSMIEDGHVDLYRKVPDRPEIARIPTFNLEQLSQDAVGTIKVDTNPPDSDFYIVSQGNEIKLGSASPSLTVTDIPVGTYNYLIRKEGYDDYRSQVTVLDSEICCVKVNLDSLQKSETCQPITQPTPTPIPSPQGASGFFITDRDILIGLGLVAAGVLIGWLISRHKD